LEIKEIIDRLKNTLNISSNKKLAELLGMNSNNVNVWLSKGTINYSTIINFAKKNELDLNYIFLGKQNNSTINKTDITLLNNKLFHFPLKAVVALIFILEKYDNSISTIDQMSLKIEESYSGLSGLIKLNFKKSIDFSTIWDKNTLVECIQYLLNDQDIVLLFSNKDHYIKYLNFIKNSKRWA